MLNKLIEKIEADRPFSPLLNIEDIVALVDYANLEIDGRLLFYGVSFRIKDSIGKLYKLRVYASVEAAVRQEGVVLLVPHVLPAFLGRDRNYLLFEFLEGRLLADNEKPDTFFQIGKICGEVNNLRDTDNNGRELEKRYYQKIDCFFKKNIVSYGDHQKIISTYREFMRDIKYEVVLGFNDIQKCNFMISSDNKLYFIDEDAVEYNIKGYGFDNVIERFYYSCQNLVEFQEEYTEAFFSGYNSVNCANFLSKNYKQFSLFLYLIDNAIYFLRTGRVQEMAIELKKLLKCNKIEAA